MDEDALRWSEEHVWEWIQISHGRRKKDRWTERETDGKTEWETEQCITKHTAIFSIYLSISLSLYRVKAGRRRENPMFFSVNTENEIGTDGRREGERERQTQRVCFFFNECLLMSDRQTERRKVRQTWWDNWDVMINTASLQVLKEKEGKERGMMRSLYWIFLRPETGSG